MRIPTPSFDYASINTPGGIAQGVAGIGAALVNARTANNKMASEAQGLARMEHRDLELARRDAERFEETKRSNLVNEDIRRQGLARLEKGPPVDPLLEERRALLQANTAKALRPAAPANTARDPRIIPAAVWNQLDQEATNEATDAMMRYKLSPEYTRAVEASTKWFNKGPVPKSPEAMHAEALKGARERRGLTHKQPWQDGPGAVPGTAPIPANAAPNGAGTIRARASALFGGALPPDWEASVLEAEAGDPDALEQIEEMLSTPTPVAQPDENDLLGAGP